MKRASTRNTRRKRFVSIVGLVIFFLLVALTMDFNGPARQAHAAVMTTPPPTMPAVTITSPANNAVVGQYTSLPITASFAVANPTTIVKVEFYATPNSSSTATLIGTATTSPYTITWTIQQAGVYTLTAKAYDVYGQVETSPPVTILVPVRDPIPLNVTLTSPANNAVYSTTTQIPITATVSPNLGSTAAVKVNFYSTPTGGTATLIGTATQAPYTITWTAPQPGTYALTAQASDNFPGDFGTSSPVNITVTTGVTPTVTPTPPPGFCQVSYAVSSQWSGGFSANITIINTGPAISSWTLAFTFPGDQQITNLWNGTASQSGEQVTITNASWNGSIASQGSVSVGFNGTWTSNNTSPTSFTLNGQTCS